MQEKKIFFSEKCKQKTIYLDEVCWKGYFHFWTTEIQTAIYVESKIFSPQDFRAELKNIQIEVTMTGETK